MFKIEKLKTIGLMLAMTLPLGLVACSGETQQSSRDSVEMDDQSMMNRRDADRNASMGMDEPSTIVNVVIDRPQFETLATAVSEAQLKSALEASGPYTLFAPTNDAFNALPSGVLQKLLKPENRGKLQMVLKFHVVRGYFPADKVMKTSRMLTLEGQSLSVDVRGNEVYIDGARVTQTNLDAKNGVVHQIDKVLLPTGFDVNSLN
ncbi:Immunogenic protein MPT70 precursor [Poriferisphaera corsica]|uniref:Immunogenic protein MPT70 n=1 Tax=Poriferisphaera corsica TaxID=2528020 RepID=A0A517YP75_9BACT|nr:fasciclin domain-containing protein [Poriferisphaera corsica]QDU32024.1 Immunogenic protein MPT70 precursor [Poriferisphaera corsica]